MFLVFNTLYLFLYFPEDKSEYIPALFWMVLFLLFTVLTMRFFIKISKKEQARAEELENQLSDKEEITK